MMQQRSTSCTCNRPRPCEHSLTGQQEDEAVLGMTVVAQELSAEHSLLCLLRIKHAVRRHGNYKGDPYATTEICY